MCVIKRKIHPALRAAIDNLNARTAVDTENINDITDALIEIGEMLSEQDDALVELAELIIEED